MKKVIKVLATTTLSLTLALPITTYASQWTQDKQGWKVQSDDGVYLTNQWYQSPESKLWYYIGENGYMLTNTYTPDGYFVNADGVWVHSAPQEPIQSESAQQTQDDSMISEEEADRIIEELGIGKIGEGKVEIVTDAKGVTLDKNGGSYNWHH